MPRPALKSVSTTALQAELQRRLDRLPLLLKMKAQVEADLAELQGLVGQFGQAFPAQVPAAEGSKPVVKRRRRRKAKVVALPAPEQVKTAPKERGVFAETGAALITRLLTKKPLRGVEIAEAWEKAGRGGTAANELIRLVKLGKLKRAPAPTGVGSVYSVAGAKPAVKTVAKPVGKKPAAKPVAKKGKRSFTCPTCKAMFDSGPKLGVHYRSEPSHRQK